MMDLDGAMAKATEMFGPLTVQCVVHREDNSGVARERRGWTVASAFRRGEESPSVSGALTAYLRAEWENLEEFGRESTATIMDAAKKANATRELLLGDFAR